MQCKIYTVSMDKLIYWHAPMLLHTTSDRAQMSNPTAKDSRRLWDNIKGLKGNLVDISKGMVRCENHHMTTANLVYSCTFSRQFRNETARFGKQMYKVHINLGGSRSHRTTSFPGGSFFPSCQDSYSGTPVIFHGAPTKSCSFASDPLLSLRWKQLISWMNFEDCGFWKDQSNIKKME